MSDEPKKRRRRWLSRTIVYATIALASYFAFHRAMAHYDWSLDGDDTGRPIVRIHRQHWWGDKPVPRWVDEFFKPASRFDDLIGYSPHDRPFICTLPARDF
jgi:hypothetical protein